MKIETNDDQLMEIQTSYIELTKRLMEERFDGFACGAIMIKLALMIYKSTLSEEEYHLMIDEISSSRDYVKTFEESNAEFLRSVGKLN
jgi:hypothetical protein